MTRSSARVVPVVAALFGVLMVGSGLSKLAGESHQVAAFAMVGLPGWFRVLVGTFEVIGGILMAVPATTPVGSLIVSTILVGALWTHASHMQWANIAPVALLLALFLWIFGRTRSRAIQLLGGVDTREEAPATPFASAVSPLEPPGGAAAWFPRLVLAAATFIMTMIAARTLADPVGATAPLGIVLASPMARTIARVGLGGFPLGFALVLVFCLVSRDRLLTGLTFLVTVVGALTAVRIQGLALDGVTAYNVKLLGPEFVILALSGAGIFVELRRRRHAGRRAIRHAA